MDGPHPHHETPRVKALRNIGSGLVIDTLNQDAGKSLVQRSYVDRPIGVPNSQAWYVDRVDN
ncbi:hypothetical protein V2I01_17840 [Micromonospora sp. BRA006-A]|nr:hypothetical protein [Micromonospora sp. BRA006-A]